MGERTQGECGVHNFMSLDKAMLRLTTSTFYRPSGKKLDKVYVPDVDDNEWGVSPEPKYTLKLSSEERKKLEDHLDRQTFIVAKEQSGKATEPGFVDRQLEMALKDLRARGE